VLAEIVRQEVEDNLLQHAAALPAPEAEQVLADYTTLLTLARPERVPLPDVQDVVRARSLIRHAADVPVVLSAMQSQPDWLLTHNTAHFTPAVATRTGLRTATPRTFTNARLRTRQEPSEVLRWPRPGGGKTAAVPQGPRQIAATACGTLSSVLVPQRSWLLALLFHRISL
jgi:hypothetical protein